MRACDSTRGGVGKRGVELIDLSVTLHVADKFCDVDNRLEYLFLYEYSVLAFHYHYRKINLFISYIQGFFYTFLQHFIAELLHMPTPYSMQFMTEYTLS